MGKRIVIALGGNALGENLPEQMAAVRGTARAIADLIQAGHEVVVAHGNGPQVGMIQKAMAELTRSDPERYIPCPLSVCVAMSQGYIGYDLQNALREELMDRGIDKGVATVLTQVEVDPADPAFQHPTKPIGAFMTQAEAEEMRRRGNPVMEDAGRGWRRVVASPRPRRVVELDTIRTLADAGQIVIACGGGGIPVLFVNSVADLDVEKYGKEIEHMTSIFPNKTNVTFTEFVSRDYLKIREWERGTGETIGCGTGCATAVVTAILTGKCDRKVTVEQIGGPLLIEWDEKTNHLFMTGPSHTVFEAEIDASHILK